MIRRLAFAAALLALPSACSREPAAPPARGETVAVERLEAMRWTREDAADGRARIVFGDDARPDAFALWCEPDSEEIEGRSRFVPPGSAEPTGHAGAWSAGVRLASGPGVRTLRQHWREHVRSPFFLIIGTETLAEGLYETGALTQIEPVAVDLSPRTEAERALIREFVGVCRSEALRGLDAGRAAADAREALKAGDRRLLVVPGAPPVVHGAHEAISVLEARHGLKPIPGAQAKHANRWRDLVRVYATEYNGVILAAGA